MVAIVSIYQNGILRAIDNDGEPWTKDVADEVMRVAQNICPSSSGRLRNSHLVTQNRNRGLYTRGFSISAGNGLPDGRALWVHNGTGIYGPRGIPIKPINTPKRKYMHVPPGMGFQWSLSFKLATPRKRRKGVRGPYVRTPDPSDPFGHAESIDGDRGNPWLERAGDFVAHRHGAI